ncbi:MAG: cytochrome c3 family protein [Opitutaceae bacterium]
MKHSTAIGILAALLGVVAIVGGIWIYQHSFVDFEQHEDTGGGAALQTTAAYGVETLGLPETPTVLSDAISHTGQPVEVACATCHTTREPAATRSSEDLDEFHQGLVMQHGDLSCLSCHNSENYDTLKLADGTTVGFENVMQLCAQCHGPQSRDYRNGSHGGMSGFWDMSKGPRQRNACTVCHDAHAPAYPQLMPVFPPKDIIPPKHADEAHH